MQELAWYVTLVVVAVIIVIFLRVIALSRTVVEHDTVQGTASRLRVGLFWGLVILGVIVAAFSLRGIPQLAARAGGDVQVVNIDSTQWSWDIDGPKLITGVPVEFRVSSSDVNHGFGIYDPELRIVAQVQAMPGYVNVLRHTFDEPGEYQIMCLEFCGVGHHNMVDSISVELPGDAAAAADETGADAS